MKGKACEKVDIELKQFFNPHFHPIQALQSL